jgi:hypothetical protein
MDDAAPPHTLDELEERLSRPTSGVCDALARAPGDVVVLGAAGKMGPSLTRMVARAATELGDGRRVVAVSRFSSPAVRAQLDGWGIETVAADLADRRALAALPDAPNVIYMAGQKFGTSAAPTAMWGMNAAVPMFVAERYAGSRIVAFSTGNVYPRTPTAGLGAAEDQPLTPVGEYANSCVARERVLDFLCSRNDTPLALVRLSYAVDLRYGVLVDIAGRVRRDEPVDVRTGFVNVIWQGDANAQAIRCLPRAASPPFVVNVTGPETLSVRELATQFGWLFRRRARLVGETAPDALLSDTSRAQRLFGAPNVSSEQLVDWVARWMAGGGPLLGKATGFEVRDGRY